MAADEPPVWVASEHAAPLSDLDRAELDNLFSYHAPVGDQVHRYGVIRASGRRLAQTIMEYAPPGEERQQALFAVRAAVMWANAGIACNPPDDGMPAAWVGGLR
jgi:hypothetical protein